MLRIERDPYLKPSEWKSINIVSILIKIWIFDSREKEIVFFKFSKPCLIRKYEIAYWYSFWPDFMNRISYEKLTNGILYGALFIIEVAKVSYTLFVDRRGAFCSRLLFT